MSPLRDNLVTRFRPTSKEDFSRYARNLSDFIGEPLQASQELLSRIYGYADLHELLSELRKPGEPGPYDGDWIRKFTPGADRTKPIADIAGRHNRMLELIAKHKGVTVATLPQAVWEVVDMGFFSSPPIHRREVKRVRLLTDVLDGTKIDGRNLAIADYAQLECRDDEAIAAFTPLGKAVYDAMLKLIPERHHSKMNNDNIGKIYKLIELHPQNPWPKAMFVCGYGETHYQGQWNYPWDSKQRPFDADPGFKRYAPGNARHFLPYATQAIKQFEEFYGKHRDHAADHRLALVKHENGGDTFYWPAILYWGGMNALNAGDLDLAYKWLNKNHKLVEGDNFGSRYYLAALRLDRGKGSVRKLFHLSGEQRTGGVWPYMAIAAQDFTQGSHKNAALMFAEALRQSFAAAEPFAGRDDSVASTQILIQDDTPATVQEFMYRTAPFWRKHPEATAFFRKISANTEVRELVRLYWAKKESMYGIALREKMATIMDEQQKERELGYRITAMALEAIK